MVDTDDTRRTTDDGRRTMPRVWHKLQTGELIIITLLKFTLFTFKGHWVQFLCTDGPLSLIFYHHNYLICLISVIPAIKLAKIWRFDLNLGYFISLGQTRVSIETRN